MRKKTQKIVKKAPLDESIPPILAAINQSILALSVHQKDTRLLASSIDGLTRQCSRNLSNEIKKHKEIAEEATGEKEEVIEFVKTCGIFPNVTVQGWISEPYLSIQSGDLLGLAKYLTDEIKKSRSNGVINLALQKVKDSGVIPCAVDGKTFPAYDRLMNGDILDVVEYLLTEVKSKMRDQKPRITGFRRYLPWTR